MNIIQIYKKYHLPENLQMHMLRVVACTLKPEDINDNSIEKYNIR